MRKEDPASANKQFQSLTNLPRFFRMIWSVSPSLTVWNIFFRLIQAALPLGLLYAGKEIIDEILNIIRNQPQSASFPGVPASLLFWIGVECGLAILSSIVGRAITLTDSLLGDLVNNDSSVRIIQHAATLDLFQFEDAAFYDKLERARTQTAGEPR